MHLHVVSPPKNQKRRRSPIRVQMDIEVVDEDLMRGIASGLCPDAKTDAERVLRIAAAMGCNPVLNGLVAR